MVVVIFTVTLTGQAHNQTKLKQRHFEGTNTTATPIQTRRGAQVSDKPNMLLINSDIVRECKRLQKLPAHLHTFEHGIAPEALKHASL